MRVAIRRDGKKTLVIEGDHIGLKAPDNGLPLMIEAEIEDGSPIQIVVGSHRAPLPVRSLKLISDKMYRVKTFERHTKAGIVTIPSHQRRMPVRLRKVHKSI